MIYEVLTISGNKEEKNHNFWTRDKFYGRTGFLLISVTIVAAYGIGGQIRNALFGTPEYSGHQTPLEGVIFILFFAGGTFLTITLTDLVGVLSNNLLKDLANKEVITPDLRDRSIRIIWSKWVYLLAGVFYIFSLISLFALVIIDKYDAYNTIGSLIVQIVASVIIAEFLWVVFMTALAILILPSKKGLILNVFSGDKAGGLSPIANYLLKVSLLITLLGSTSIYWGTRSTTEAGLIASILYLLGVIALPIIYFMIPSIGLNRFMKAEKFEVLNELALKMTDAYETLKKSPDSITGDYLEQIQLTQVLFNQASTMQEWPFSFSGLRNLLTSFLLPIIVFLITNYEQILSFLNIS